MARRHEAAALLKSGHTIPDIARHLGRDVEIVIQDLRLQVGEGQVKLSELFFAIPAQSRHSLESLIRDTGAKSAAELQKVARPLGFSWHGIDLYLQLRDPRIFRGDFYERIADIELALHDFCRSVLIAQFGPEEAGWWRRGIPKAVRTACVQAREEDPEPVDDFFSYSTLIHLAEIVDYNWDLFRPKLSSKLATDKKRLMQNLRRLNTLRNAVMHPVKRRSWTQADFEFVAEFERSLVPNPSQRSRFAR